MQTFELGLKNEKIKQYKIFALLIIALNILFLAILAVEKKEIRYSCITAIILVAIFFIIEHFSRNKKEGNYARAGAVLLITITYMTLEFWWPAFVMVVLSGLYLISIRKLVVKVSSDHLFYPSFPRRVIEWTELNNIVLKDDILTIDFKSNKIIQQLIEKTEPPIDEKEFNDFCKVQLNARTAIVNHYD